MTIFSNFEAQQRTLIELLTDEQTLTRLLQGREQRLVTLTEADPEHGEALASRDALRTLLTEQAEAIAATKQEMERAGEGLALAVQAAFPLAHKQAQIVKDAVLNVAQFGARRNVLAALQTVEAQEAVRLQEADQ